MAERASDRIAPATQITKIQTTRPTQMLAALRDSYDGQPVIERKIAKKLTAEQVAKSL